MQHIAAVRELFCRHPRSFQCISAWPESGQAEMYQPGDCLPGGSGDVGGDNIGGMPVQRGTGSVTAHRGPRISVGSGFLDIPQRDPGIQRGGDERVPQRVRPDGLGEPGPAGDPPDDPPGGVTVHSGPSAATKIGPSVRSPMARSIARAVRGASGTVTTLPPLRVTTKVRCRVRCPALRYQRRWPRRPVARSARAARSAHAPPAGPRPAATRRAPSSLRSSPTAWDS
jgi:hypothetical protein